MDMSVTIKPAEGDGQRQQAPTQTRARGANASDLDLWLEKVEAMGELKRITAEVDPDLEAATITYLVGAREIARRCCSRTSRAIPATRRSTT